MTQTAVQTSPPTQFYRRPLPLTCVDFGSDEGKILFTEALKEGNINIYFKLAPQFQTQEDPAYCGLSTLVMTLNALEVDPGQVWKGPWRWYHESMLDCCKPLDQVKLTGITVEQFACLARCNRLMVEKIYASSDDDLMIENFRASVIRSTQSDNEVLVVSYDRKVLGQTGSGHFSTIGGYHSGSDKLLILDVARFKYPPHWVDVNLLWKAMRSFDAETNRPRGYFRLMLTLKKPLLLLQIIMDSSDLHHLNTCFKSWLAKANDNSVEGIDESKLVTSLLQLWETGCFQKAVSLRDGLEMTTDGCFCCHGCNMTTDHFNTVQFDILQELTSLPEFHYLHHERKHQPKESLLCASLFLAWPFENFDGAIPKKLADYCTSKIGQLSDSPRNEILLLKTQLITIMSDFLNNKCCSNCI